MYYLHTTNANGMKHELIIIGRFTFNAFGFSATYSINGKRTTLTLCPKATCQLFEEAGLIEGFDLDENMEPVILFTQNDVRSTYGFDRWASFVCTFPVSYRMAVKLLEYREERKAHRAFQSAVDQLLSPLAA